jgi:hypothetical protein
MFLINTFQWPWTQIAALIPPRPMLFENSGHDTIFPMNGNDRIRARLEKLYGFYTNRTDRLFDIGVTPGGHDDKPELRLMAYRWINHFLKKDDSPVTEPDLPKFEGQQLRAFPDQLPADELNTKIDELFVPMATNTAPKTAEGLDPWRKEKLAELRRLAFRSIPDFAHRQMDLKFGSRKPELGTVVTEPGIVVPWKFFPGQTDRSRRTAYLVVLDDAEQIESPPAWVQKSLGDASVLLVAPRGSGPLQWSNPPPYYIRRSLALLGRTVDSCKLADVLAIGADVLGPRGKVSWKVAGRGQAGMIAAYAGILESRFDGVVMIDPPASHREGPIFLNVLRVIDIPEVLGLLAPRSLVIHSSQQNAFEPTAALYRLARADFKLLPLP